MPWNIAGGVRLYRARYVSPSLVGRALAVQRRKLFDHDLRSYDTAVKAVKRYEAEVVPERADERELADAKGEGAGDAMSVRNRELANLVAVGALTALGFASARSCRQNCNC